MRNQPSWGAGGQNNTLAEFAKILDVTGIY